MDTNLRLSSSDFLGHGRNVHFAVYSPSVAESKSTLTLARPIPARTDDICCYVLVDVCKAAIYSVLNMLSEFDIDCQFEQCDSLQ